MDVEPSPQENLKYPTSVWCIVLNELCERFCFFGFRTVLVLYLTTILEYDGDNSTMIYHSFIFFSYFMPLFGAVLADSYWGKFKTIMRLSIVYVLGNLVLTGSSVAEALSLNVQRTIALLGLFFISIGTGGIKPCVFTFGGDQFQLPQQEKQLQHYTTNFMVAINLGALVSTFLTPELRNSVKCFGHDTCYPVAFGVPAALMLIAIMIFMLGKNMYVKKKPEHNYIYKTFSCMFYALRSKFTTSVPCKSHWLDHAMGAYTETEITETKTALNVIAVFTAYPVFWALYEQQGSRWTLQATLMNGRIEYLGWTIKPDQMQTLVPFFGLIFLFAFDIIFYPLLAKVGIRRPLQKLTLSGCLASVAFVFAALVQWKIFGNSTEIPVGQGHLNFYNGFDCDAFISWPSSLHQDDHTIGALETISVDLAVPSKDYVFEVELKFGTSCTRVPKDFKLNATVAVVQSKVVSYYLTRGKQETIVLNRIGNYDNLIKAKTGYPSLRLLLDYINERDENMTVISADKNSFNSYPYSSFKGEKYQEIKLGKYNVLHNGQIILAQMNFIPATFYTLIIQHNGEKLDSKLLSMDEGNYIHILWQLPQFLIMIIADVIFVVTNLEFSYSEAPLNIKSFISAVSLLTTSIGNLLVVIISAIGFKNQAHEYLFYSGLMLADTLLLAYFSVIYLTKSTENNETPLPTEDMKEENIVF